jgi:hypothetical protein
MAGGAVALMTASTVGDLDWLARWSILASILAAGMCLRAAVREVADNIQSYIKRWSHDVFEDGLKRGIEIGREMEATRQFISSTRDRD